jgi:arylsulfatase A-like enzyme
MHPRISLPLLIPLALASGPAALAASDHTAPRPNIIFIMVDDLGYGDLGSYGQALIQTPQLDQMAAEGMRFTQVYAGSPVCAPARSVLMTGQHTGNTRVRGNFGTPGSGVQDSDGNWRVPLRPEDKTVAEVLREAGYVTGITGKWGLGEEGTTGIPNLQGFNEWYGLLNQRQAHSHYPAFVWRDQTKEFLPGNTGTVQDFVTEAHYLHDLLTAFALGFIGRHAPEEAPFFLYLPYTLPHSAFQIPELEPYAANTNWTQREKVYASMITRMDRDVGRIMAALDEQGIADNTIIFFCSDNGAANRYDNRFQSSGELRGRKRDLYEGGIRTPMLVRWPGTVPAGVVSDAIWYFPDVLPTLAELAGAETPTDIDGVSVVPTLLGTDQPELAERPLYWEFHEDQFGQAIRLGDWKAVRQNPHEPAELYHLPSDIGESQNVAAAHPEIIAAMENRFITMRSPSTAWPTVLDDAVPTPPAPPGVPAFEAGWLPLDQTDGFTALDHSGWETHASMINFSSTAAWGSDATGRFLQFNGAASQYLRIQGRTGAAGDTPRTFATWLRSSEPGVLVAWGSRSNPGEAWVVRIDPASRALRVEIQNGFIIGSTPLTNNQWHHIAVVFDPENRGDNITSVRLFVNGLEESISASLARTVRTTAGTPIWIGGEDGRPDLSFSGHLRNLQWWTTALTPTAVSALAQPGKRHGERWHRIHFPHAPVDLSAPAPGSRAPLMLHYAGGILPFAALSDLPRIDPLPDRSLRLSTRLGERARLNIRPFGARQPDGPWSDASGEFIHAVSESEHSWTLAAPLLETRFFRLEFELGN